MKQDIDEHSFERDDMQSKYDRLRAEEGWTPDRAALKVIRDEYKSKKSTISTLEDQCDELKERAEDIANGQRFEIDEENGERFRYQPYSGNNVKNAEEFREKFPDIFEEYVYTYSGKSPRFD
ncbi:MAG: hypothetical protein ABEN55_08715 [Bradymonadaceae bacterium]